MNLKKLNIRIVLLLIFICLCGCGSNKNNETYPIVDIEDDISETIKKDDIHSIWVDGKEIKILEYIDEKSMLAKFEVGTCIVQMILPRSLETETYVVNYEEDIWDDIKKFMIEFINKDKQDAFLCAVEIGVNDDASEQFFMDVYSNSFESIEKYERLDSGTRVICHDKISGLSLSGPWEEFALDGYITCYYDTKMKGLVGVAILNADESEQESGKTYLESIQIRESNDEDFVSRIESQTDDYEQRMLNMYAKYVELLDDPTTYLQEKHNAVGELYEMHYLYDFTEDGIPEIVFMGNPNWICIVGEKSSLNISGSDIAWSKIPSEFFVRTEWTGEVTWQKYKLEVDDSGYIIATIIDQEYLCSSYDIDNDKFIYTYQGQEISENKFWEKEKQLKDVDIPAPWMYDLEGYVASEKLFYRSVTCLSNNRIDEE